MLKRPRFLLFFVLFVFALFGLFYSWPISATADPVLKGYQKISVKEGTSHTLLILALSVIAIFAVFFAAYAYRYRLFSLTGGRFYDEVEEVNRLVNSFHKMVVAIEGRDVVLRGAKDKAVQENEAKSDFILSVSHELRTPMHAILNFAEMGRKKVSDDNSEKIQLYFSRIEESGERLLGLINELLDLTRLESGNIELNKSYACVYEIVKSCNDQMMSLIEAKNLDVKINKPQGKVCSCVDKARISQVVINLLSNAIKFTPENKKIVISIDKKDDNLRVSVENEGTKIPDEEIDAVFNKFVQGSVIAPGVGGSGVGLAICKEIIKLHNGDIWAENNKNGVNFSFTVPVIEG